MKALLMALVVASFSANAFAAIEKAVLNEEEVSFAIELSNKYKADFEVNGPCSESTFELWSVVDYNNEMDFYTFESSKGDFRLTPAEISKLEALEKRLGVTSIMIEQGVFYKKTTISGKSCGFSPNKWTAEFNR